MRVSREKCVINLATPRALPVHSGISMNGVAEIGVRDFEIRYGITMGIVGRSISFVVTANTNMAWYPEQNQTFTLGGKNMKFTKNIRDQRVKPVVVLNGLKNRFRVSKNNKM